MKVIENSRKFVLIVCLVLGFASACTVTSPSQDNKTAKTVTKTDYKGLAMRAMEALFANYDVEGAKQFFDEDYIQHNPYVPTGRAPVLEILPALEAAGTKATVHRVLQDGDFVVLHSSYHNAEAFGGKELVAFDVWRIADGKIAEHWDNLQPRVDNTASGRSQVDGPTRVKDLDKTQSNKTVVKKLLEDVFFGANPQKITDYISVNQYDQHNPMVKDGLAGLSEAMEYLSAQNDLFVYTKVHKILGEGNFIFVMSEGHWHGKPHAFFDLFRLENDRIVEHWDVIQEIPTQMAHTNGKF